METSLRRLYIGGLGPSVTDAELSERFGRFGKVGEVDIICRKDDQGNPVRTFAYMNINISDTDLKKCLSLLNKTKWKGGLLQIEMAKESFLHKLEQERQAAKEKKKPKEQSRPQNDLFKSLEKAGVTDFQMKAAVPGTEVPNHKNWVVSKYGRVLPVLHLKGNKESKDPSKYCHNVKKLDNISLVSTPVAQLTWHLDGGNDDISKKRRGEFPEFKSPVKKSRVNSYNTCKTEERENNIRTPQVTPQKTADTVVSQQKGQNCGYVGNKSINSMSDDEYDSEEELKTIIEREKMVAVGERHTEDVDIEVVDNSFTPRYKTLWAEEIGNHRGSNSISKDENEYDSADTDEIITVARTSQNCRNGKSEKSPKNNVVSTEFSNSKCHVNQENGRTEEDDQSNGTEDSSDSCSDEEYKSMMQNCYRLDLTIEDLEALTNNADESDNDEADDQNGSDQEYDSADTDIVIAGAKCVQRGIVGGKKGSDSKESTKDKAKVSHTRDLGAGDCNIELGSGSRISYLESNSVKQDPSVRTLNSPGKNVSKSTSNDENSDVTSEGEEAETQTCKSTKNTLGNGNLKRKKGIEPEDIVASILEEDDSSNDESKRKRKTNPLPQPPAFKGLGSLMSSLSVSVSCAKSYHPEAVSCERNGNALFTEDKGHQDTKHKGEKPPKTDQNASTDAHWNSESLSSSGSSGSDESSSDEEVSSASKSTLSQKSSAEGQPNARTKRLQDNQKRLAAMEERRKEREQQKQAIQGALIKLDSQTAKKSQHIVFDSESEEESEEVASTSNRHKEKTKPIKAKLFDSSGEDSDDEEEKDDERFEIKTQYEGRSGEKLMVLQSRFGTDERFKMDSRFLEDSSEEEADTEKHQKSQADDGLSAEKKKNLDILQSVLNINMEPQTTSKKAANAKTFKDLNALQYDPTKENHAVFETKAEEEKKESKAARKKKRLEAEKLPEVSKEIFHEVVIDFKEVFGAPKPQATEEPETTWDKVEEPQKMEVETSMSNMELGLQKTEEPAGFTFSFFGTSAEESVTPHEPYKIETIKAAKVAWQEDPRFQDSSSEGEEEVEEDTTDTAANTSLHLEKSRGIRFFFFVKDDTRLKEGPKMFIRSSISEQKAKDWDHMRDSIMEQCRKRHKDAKRRLKTKQ
ncbi:nucleolar protein 8 isoform X2 [Dendrobates tinctorius]|uniref:nucleolar protein 8 isoform X2 n=1 Tax=Dendrobates tinctorius TaxID=92724 RepID=UPI003CC9C7F2